MNFLKIPRVAKVMASVLFIAAGAALGYAYYRFWGCSGTCAITSSPYRSAAYGGIMGLLIRLIVL